MDRQGAGTIEVRAEAYESYNRQVDERMKGTVWDSGCASFYLDATGRNGVLWPDWTWRFRRLATRFDEQAYALSRPTARGCRDMSGKRIIITGAASGIAAATMAELRARGARVSVWTSKRRVTDMLACDVRDQGSVDRPWRRAIDGSRRPGRPHQLRGPRDAAECGSPAGR